MRPSADLAQISDQQARSFAAERRPEIATWPGGGAASGVSFQTAKITGFGTGNQTFVGKLVLDSIGTLGPTITIYARSYPAVGGAFGFQDLTACDPPFIAGDFVAVYYGSFYTGAGVLTGYFVVDSFFGACP